MRAGVSFGVLLALMLASTPVVAWEPPDGVVWVSHQGFTVEPSEAVQATGECSCS
jgi:hypothetical protein